MISHTTIKGTFVSSKTSTEKNTMLTTIEDIGVKNSLILPSIVAALIVKE